MCVVVARAHSALAAFIIQNEFFFLPHSVYNIRVCMYKDFLIFISQIEHRLLLLWDCCSWL